jgi:thioredoxin reductase
VCWPDGPGPGVFAAGDVPKGSVERVASAVAEGALAVTLVHADLAALGEDEGSCRPRR